ncbi:hypothetical protein [Streptomyces sp. CL12]|uniref:hypothetical protein n=1 Tax=Streptomyces sp. CL12 TaxID=3391744 RepID=UPI003A801222
MSDEEWERFLRESVAGAAGAPGELPARARSLERRSRQSPRRPGGRRRVGWYVTGFLAVVALLGAALFPQRIVGWFGGGGQETAPLAAESERPRTAPGAEPELRPTLTEPFRGSPAARWADGAGPDSHVLRGERPSKAIAVLNPRQRDAQRYLRAALSAKAPTPETDPLLLFSRFRPDQARLVGDVVKTRGRLSYRERRRGAVEVTADVTFVYPVTPAEGGGEVLSTMSLLSYARDLTNGGCSAPTGYFVPPFGNTQHPGQAHRLDPYDRSKPLDKNSGARPATGNCATATRS